MDTSLLFFLMSCMTIIPIASAAPTDGLLTSVCFSLQEGDGLVKTSSADSCADGLVYLKLIRTPDKVTMDLTFPADCDSCLERKVIATFISQGTRGEVATTHRFEIEIKGRSVSGPKFASVKRVGNQILGHAEFSASSFVGKSLLTNEFVLQIRMETKSKSGRVEEVIGATERERIFDPATADFVPRTRGLPADYGDDKDVETTPKAVTTIAEPHDGTKVTIIIIAIVVVEIVSLLIFGVFCYRFCGKKSAVSDVPPK